ncbi:hypothetical protein HZA97_03320 [Candidatus Woesearchaeota archaeon]|nr:hypothetical protein [Candidatus Woesearchaeota archaeon]
MENNSSQLSLEQLSTDLILDLERNRRAFFITVRDELRGAPININELSSEKPSFLGKFNPFATKEVYADYDEKDLRAEYKKKCRNFVEKKLGEVKNKFRATQSADDINALEPMTSQDKFDQIEEQINSWFFPQYVEDSFEQTKIEDQKYKLVFGRGVGRAGYFATGAAAGWLLLKTPPFWIFEIPVDLGIAVGGLVYPEAKRWFVDKAYNRKLNTLVKEARQYDKKTEGK